MSNHQSEGKIERLRKSDWSVRPCSHANAKVLIKQYHYSKGCSNTGITHGLYRASDDSLMGVALWIPPTKSCAVWWAQDEWKNVLSLSRLAIHPDVPTNACSFLIARSAKMLPPRWDTLVTYADEWRGHSGAIYKAANWTFAGETKAERCYTINGRMTARKRGNKTRTHSEMLELGAVLEGSFKKKDFSSHERRAHDHTATKERDCV